MDEILERTNIWSSSEYNANNAWNVNFGTGNMNNNNKFAQYRVRPVAALQEITYDIPLESVFDAFFDCIKHKKSAPQCVDFCMNYLPKLISLWEEIITGKYQPSTSYCFLVNWPTWREIFAAAFRDRIVHHWICLREIPLFEQLYHEIGDVSYNCRKGFGTLRAVFQFEEMLYTYTKHYTADCWILEIDIKSFFMSISKSLLWEMSEIFLRDNYKQDDIECLLYLHRTVLFHSPQNNCRLKSPRYLWKNLPADKSMFNQDEDRGTAIGNHNVQQWANFYVCPFDYYIVFVLGFKNRYIRFVDDAKLISTSKEELIEVSKKLQQFLSSQLLLTLHPKKVHIRNSMQGCRFIGTILKKDRIYINNRTRGALVTKIQKFNAMLDAGMAEQVVEKFVSIINSYYGLMFQERTYEKKYTIGDKTFSEKRTVCYKTYTLRRRYAKWILEKWHPYLYFTNDFKKAVVKGQYKHLYQVRAALRKGHTEQFFSKPFTIKNED